jgi:hypothetical protein
VDSAVQSDALANCYESEARPLSYQLKLVIWIGATAASWAVVIGFGRLALALLP